ncbi:MBL fold metallo-hydrolase [Jidongwangia harbinensis]|uniref:MBL fold metallo-hydrolase n=1 Tax=Jidongwangia harbinensis TaxID=2878561 RepID=UPI001CD921C0|nr:MBL fold metallo-hydrolase [Jidongwangia harbinensis]MCA2218561.1 MBL fold metallo-hydrolase [Jidongwangia harbinensis]
MLRRALGPLTVTAVQDAEGPFFEPRERAFPDATPAQWAAADAFDPAARTADGRWWLRFRSFAIRYADGPVTLVDAGIGPAGAPAKSWAPVPGRLPDALAEAGIAPGDVAAIVLTHLHTDHIGWAMPATTPFPQARVVVPKADLAAFAAVREADLFGPLRAAGRLEVTDGEREIASGVRVLPTPGHTPGHQCVVVSGPEGRLVVTGDLLVHAIQLLHPELGYAHDMDAGRARVSRASVLAAGGELAVSHLGTPFLRTGR